MLEIKCEDYLTDVLSRAYKLGALDQLKERLNYLSTYASGKDQSCEEVGTRCVLFRDWHDMSFEFVMYRGDGNGGWVQWFNGGLVYHGPGPDPLSVELVSDQNPHWSIHT